jgi:hypothetical protein
MFGAVGVKHVAGARGKHGGAGYTAGKASLVKLCGCVVCVCVCVCCEVH